MLFRNLSFVPVHAKQRRELQLLAEYFEIGGRKNSCNYLDVSDKFGDNLGPNDLHNYSSSYRRILLDSAKKKIVAIQAGLLINPISPLQRNWEIIS